MKFAIGQPYARIEDPRLLTGGGRYTDDVKLPADTLRAFVLRSPHAHAEIRRIDTAAALKAPGVAAVYTHADVAADGLGDMPCMIPIVNRDGSPRGDTPRPILASGRARHVGDPVALVVADTLEHARDAAELVEIDWRPLPSVTGTMDAAKPGAPLVWDAMKGNVCFDWEMGDRAAVDAAFAAAHRTVRLEIVNNRVVVNAMEPRAAAATYDPASGRTTLYTPSQGVHIVHPQIADMVLKIGKDKLRVVSGDVGGGFGMKIFLYAEQCLVPWASRKLKRAVRWTADRSEGFVSDTQGRDHVSVAEMALDKDCRFLGLRVTTHAALGAYLSNFGPFIPTDAGSTMLNGLYTTKAIYVNVKGMMTNTVPTDAYRGAGRPEASYLVERLVDHIARETGLSVDEIRARNHIPPASLPYKTVLGDLVDSGDFTALMRECMKRADWDGFAAREAESRKRGKLRGRGLATYVEKCSGGNAETAVARFEDDDTVTVIVGNQTNGQGHETMLTQLFSARLGIDGDRIRIVQGDSDIVPWGLTGGSRATPVTGAATIGLADKVVAKGKIVAADALEAAAGDIAYADGKFTIVGTDRSVTLFEVARRAKDPKYAAAGAKPGLDDEYTRTPEAPTFPNGCHICEIEIDPETGTSEIARYTVVDDFGKAINPLLLMGQVHGGIGQGVGQALTERTVYDAESGQLLSGSFMDYTMPRADNFVQIDFAMHNSPCPTNPLGIKGAGEAGAIGSPPAVINAIVDALHRAVGVKHIDMPATPDAVWRALHGAAKKAA